MTMQGHAYYCMHTRMINFILYKIMATVGAVVDPPTSKPHHPDLTFSSFLKDPLGRRSQSIESAWFVQWPFLHYDQSKDPVYCHTCALAFKKKSQVAIIDQVSKLMQIILVMPATNASSERSFSALRRVKSYLRSTMLQERLNYLMLLHVHKDRTDKLCLKTAINE